jgi:hypothetical protein
LIGGWIDPRAGLDVAARKKSLQYLCWETNPRHPAYGLVTKLTVISPGHGGEGEKIHAPARNQIHQPAFSLGYQSSHVHYLILSIIFTIITLSICEGFKDVYWVDKF